MHTHREVLAILNASGFDSLCNALQKALHDVSVPERVVQSFIESLQPYAAFLKTFPEELAARLYEAAFDDESLRLIIENWLVDAPKPWLRVTMRRAHGENPVCLDDALHVSPNEALLFICGAHRELWSLRAGERLWSNTRYFARDITFSEDSLYIVGEDIDYAGMTDYNRYMIILEAKTGNEVFYEDDYRTTGAIPSAFRRAVPASGYDVHCAYEKNTLERLHWTISDGGRILARLPGRFKHCISAPRSRDVIAIDAQSFVVYQMVS